MQPLSSRTRLLEVVDDVRCNSKEKNNWRRYLRHSLQRKKGKIYLLLPDLPTLSVSLNHTTRLLRRRFENHSRFRLGMTTPVSRLHQSYQLHITIFSFDSFNLPTIYCEIAIYSRPQCFIFRQSMIIIPAAFHVT